MADERAVEDRIRARAHEIWTREGCPDGEAARHWDEARLEIEAENRVTQATTAEPDPAGEAALATPAEEAGDTPEPMPEEGWDRGAADQSMETEASGSQLERTPI